MSRVVARLSHGLLGQDGGGTWSDADTVLTTATPPGNWIPAADADVRIGVPNGLSSQGTLPVPVAAAPMSMLEGCYNDEAILWRRTGMDAYGKDTFDSPVPVFVRWQRISELFVDKQGREKRSRAIVYFSAGANVNEGDRVMAGNTYEPQSSDVPQTAWPVDVIQDAKALDGSVVQQKAYL